MGNLECSRGKAARKYREGWDTGALDSPHPRAGGEVEWDPGSTPKFRRHSTFFPKKEVMFTTAKKPVSLAKWGQSHTEISKRRGSVAFTITGKGGGFYIWAGAGWVTVGGRHGADSELASWAQKSRPSGSPGVKFTYKNYLSLCLSDPFISALTPTWNT